MREEFPIVQVLFSSGVLIPAAKILMTFRLMPSILFFSMSQRRHEKYQVVCLTLELQTVVITNEYFYMVL